jgi:hypothetical protein
MNHKQKPKSTTPTAPSPGLTLQVTISNGNPRWDTKLTFEFAPRTSCQARLWVVGLPRLSNPDAFPRQTAPNHWELRLDALAETQPIEIAHYTSENAQDFLERFFKPAGGAPAELLILAQGEKFTVTVSEFSGRSA